MRTQNLAQRLLRIIGLGRLTVVDDSGVQQLAQVNIASGGPGELEEIIDQTPRLAEYGLASCPPAGAEAVVIYLGGRRSSGVIIATGHRPTRPTGLQPGEAMLYNGLTGAYVKLCADGKIRSHGDWIHEGSFSATGDILDHMADGHGQTMRASRQTYDTHTHPAGTPNTGVPNQQEPT